MFESLTAKLQATFDKLSKRGKLSDKDVDVALREVRLALLEADVNYKVVRTFVKRVKERALGAEVMRSLTPSGRPSARNGCITCVSRISIASSSGVSRATS